MINYSNLHVHTTFSVFDAIGYPAQILDYIVKSNSEDRQVCCAFTDHGNCNSFPYAIEAAKKINEKWGREKAKIIFGVEAYFVRSVSEWEREYAEFKETKKEKKAKVEDELEATSHSADEITQKGLYRRSHLLILAQNPAGYRNLCRLVSKSFTPPYFYTKPRMDFDLLAQHSEGIICSTACIAGYLTRSYLLEFEKEKNVEAAETVVRQEVQHFLDIFGDRFYLELQYNGIPLQWEMNNLLIKLSREMGIPLISTADAHYPSPELWRDRLIYKSLGFLKGKTQDAVPATVEEVGYELYPKNGEQMFASFQQYVNTCQNCNDFDNDDIIRSISNADQIAHDRFESYYPDNKTKTPRFLIGEDEDADVKLIRICKAAMVAKGLDKKKAYIDRLRKELDVILTRKLSEYFLTMKIIVDEGWKHMLIGVARGSAGGCLVAYLTGITQLDPIRFGLMFERFLSKSGKDYPDIDVDFADKDQMRQILQEKWGEDHVVQVTNFSTMKIKSLLKDLAKLSGVEYQDINEITTKIDDEAMESAKDLHEIDSGMYEPTYEDYMMFSPTFKNFLNSHPEIEKHFTLLQGMVRSLSTHAGGVVIGDNIADNLPLIRLNGKMQTPFAEGQRIRHLEKHTGYLKYDILAIEALKIFTGAIRRIIVREGGFGNFGEIKSFYLTKMHPDVIDFNDQNIYKEIYHKGRFLRTFQFTHKPVQEFCKACRPDSIDQVSNTTALFRPGPLSSHVDKAYLEAKRNPKKVKYLHPLLKDVLEKSLGFCIYQEDLASISHILGDDIDLDEGNKLRKILIKKGIGEIEDEKKRIHEKFVRGCEQKGIKTEEAQKTWEEMIKFAAYGFNLSHSMAYSVVSYQSAYLWHYYPLEWAAAVLDAVKPDEKAETISDVEYYGIKVLPPDINLSGPDWAVNYERHALVAPFTAIKGIGDVAAEELVKCQPFKDLNDLLFRPTISGRKVNKKILALLALSGALDSLLDARFTGLKHLWSCLAAERPKTLQDLSEAIEAFKDEGQFTDAEVILNKLELTGIFPLDLVVSEETKAFLDAKKIPSLGSVTKRNSPYAWFVPLSCETRYTKEKKKPYYVLKVTDSSGKTSTFRVWGVVSSTQWIRPFKLYLAKDVSCDPKWGYSVGAFGNLKLIG